MCLVGNLDNSIQGKNEVTWKSRRACGEQGEGGIDSRLTPMVNLTISFQAWLYWVRECKHYALIHKITDKQFRHSAALDPQSYQSPSQSLRPFAPRQSTDRSEPRRAEAGSSNRKQAHSDLISVWIAICNWKNSFFEKWHSALCLRRWGCVDLEQKKSFSSCTVIMITGSASYLQPWYLTLTQRVQII